MILRGPPGSSIFLYSDALIETPAPPNSIFSPESLEELLADENLWAAPATVIKAHVLDMLMLSMTDKMEDDLTVVVLQHTEG